MNISETLHLKKFKVPLSPYAIIMSKASRFIMGVIIFTFNLLKVINAMYTPAALYACMQPALVTSPLEGI